MKTLERRGDTSSCTCRRKTQDFKSLLRERKIFPIAESMNKKVIGSVLDEIEEFQKGLGWVVIQGCEHCDATLAETLQRLTNRWKALRGFCLDCIRDAEVCRAHHAWKFRGLSATQPFSNGED